MWPCCVGPANTREIEAIFIGEVEEVDALWGSMRMQQQAAWEGTCPCCADGHVGWQEVSSQQIVHVTTRLGCG